MQTAKAKVLALLERLPADCSLDDIQYQLYVISKVENSLTRAEVDGYLTQEEVDQGLKAWLSA